MDQAVAGFVALTSARRAELIVGPAGTGKTYTAVRITDAWQQAGLGQVIGIATTSAARNVLQEAGIPAAVTLRGGSVLESLFAVSPGSLWGQLGLTH